MPILAVENQVTVQNLFAAFEGESNAHAKYIAFAVKADEEGFHGIASLFRAAGRAEQIHAANHVRVFMQLGGEARNAIHPVVVTSTLENLRTALDGELHEVEKMYPSFIAEAQTHNNTLAVRTFTGALEAEKAHVRLYSEAIALLKSEKSDSWIWSAREFYVCPVCGDTTETEEEHEHCQICNAPWEKFEIIR